MNVDYSTKIPKQRESSEDRAGAESRWKAGIPATWTGGATWGRRGFPGMLVYLAHRLLSRSARLGSSTMSASPDYRWGILLAPQEEEPRRPVR